MKCEDRIYCPKLISTMSHIIPNNPNAPNTVCELCLKDLNLPCIPKNKPEFITCIPCFPEFAEKVMKYFIDGHTVTIRLNCSKCPLSKRKSNDIVLKLGRGGDIGDRKYNSNSSGETTPIRQSPTILWEYGSANTSTSFYLDGTSSGEANI